MNASRTLDRSGASPLEAMVRERGRLFARRRRGPVGHSMLLEDQEVRGKYPEKRLDEIVRQTNPRLFWG
jgi:hypothetical protein